MNNTRGMLDYFSVLVIGDNADDRMIKFDSMKDLDKPYILFNNSDKNKIRTDTIKIYKGLLKTTKDPETLKSLKNKIEELINTSDIEYYSQLGELHSFDVDGNIITTENPDGKWLTCERGGKIFSNYLKNFNDNQIVSGKKNEIDWNLTHLKKDRVQLYERTWDLCVDKLEPITEKDHQILKNMRIYDSYFGNFKDKSEYVNYNCSFWTYAILLENETWLDMEHQNEIEWVKNFYNNFIKNLPEDKQITIYECTK